MRPGRTAAPARTGPGRIRRPWYTYEICRYISTFGRVIFGLFSRVCASFSRLNLSAKCSALFGGFRA